LRDSAGFAPASLSSPSGEDARSERFKKNGNNRTKNLMGKKLQVNQQAEHLDARGGQCQFTSRFIGAHWNVLTDGYGQVIVA
jgi:hypothetical protein